MAMNSGTRGHARIWFLGVGVVAAAALVIFLKNYPPQPADAAGTVGAAQRYNSPQIAKSDVTVTPDELTTWIQSDTFDRIVKDPEARAIFTSEAFSRLVSDASARNFLVREGGTFLATHEAAAKYLVAAAGAKIAMEDSALMRDLDSEGVKRILSEKGVTLALAQDASRTIVVNDEAVSRLVRGNEAFQTLIENDAVREFLGVAARSKMFEVAMDAGGTVQVFEAGNAGGKTKTYVVAKEAGDAASMLGGDASRMRVLDNNALNMVASQGTAGGRFIITADAAKVLEAGEAAAKLTVRDAAQFMASDAAKVMVANPAWLVAGDAVRMVKNSAIMEAVGNDAFFRLISERGVMTELVNEAHKAD